MKLMELYTSIIQEKIIGGDVSEKIFKDILKDENINTIIDILNSMPIDFFDSINSHDNNKVSKLEINFNKTYNSNYVEELLKNILVLNKDTGYYELPKKITRDTKINQYKTSLNSKTKLTFDIDILLLSKEDELYSKYKSEASVVILENIISEEEIYISSRITILDTLLNSGIDKNEFVSTLRHEFQHIIQSILIKVANYKYDHVDNPNYTKYKHEDSPSEFDARITEFAYFLKEEDEYSLFDSKDGIINSYEYYKFSEYAEYFRVYNKQQFINKLYQLDCTNKNYLWFKNKLIQEINTMISKTKLTINKKDSEIELEIKHPYLPLHIQSFIIDLMLKGRPLNNFVNITMDINSKLTSIKSEEFKKIYAAALFNAITDNYEYRSNKYSKADLFKIIKKDSFSFKLLNDYWKEFTGNNNIENKPKVVYK